MSIGPEDVKLFESQRLTDENDGGGRATGNVIIDGDINNLFPDISRLDRTVGDVALRKAFLGIDTDNQDVYLGAHAIIESPPADPNVHVVLFDAGSESDTRLSAKNRIESYLVQGAKAQWLLLGNQYENQRQIVVIQREEVALPAAGDVFLLKEGANEQYIRVTEVDAAMATFSYLSGSSWVDFNRRRIVLSISAPLQFTFTGGEASPSGTTGSNKAEGYSTEVADAARYWGVKSSTEEAEIGDLQIKVPSIYASLVPSAQTEQPLIDQVLGYDRLVVIPAATADYTEALTATYTSGTALQVFIGRPAVRGTLQLALGGSNYTDNGSGTLTRSSGSFPFAELAIDYDSGAIYGTRDSGTGSGNVSGSATYRPGAALIGSTQTHQTEVTISNRGYNWTQTFADEKPRPGTLIVSYMAQGRWYEVRDNGTGQLEGVGSGSVSYVTGSVLVTLEALPDAGSAIMYSWISNIEEEYEQHNATVATMLPEVVLGLEEAVIPSSVTITYTAGAVEKTVTDNGTGGLTGDGTGTIDYSTGIVTLKTSVLHDDGTGFDVDYDAGNQITGEVGEAWVPGTGTVSGTLDNTGILAGSVYLTIKVSTRGWGTTTRYEVVRDDGAGGWIGYAGTINYSSGAWSISGYEIIPSGAVRNTTLYTSATENYQRASQEILVHKVRSIQDVVSIGYRLDTDTDAPVTLSGFQPSELRLDLADISDDVLIEGSILFTFAGEKYFDRDGILYKNFDSKTGAGVSVGSVNYYDRTATLNSWAGGASPGVTVHAALTAATQILSSSVVFRTPAAPVRPTSMQISVTDAEGNIISVTANNDGDFIGANVSGHINYETGVTYIRFTTDDGDETGDSDIPVMPNGTYNAVLYTFLPLDAELIGLDPVRLPGDGRVPIFRKGDVIVISHTAETDADTPTNGEVVTLARDHQASILVFDDDGVAMDPAQYTVNKMAGTVTFADPVVLQDADENALTAPLTIRDRVEHMSVIGDVEITGEISFIAPLAHDFPANETVVSSALVWGDINSRYFNFFTQKTWNSGSPNWSDSRIGDDTTANYNDVDNPIEIANRGAITENWALIFTSSTGFNIVGETLGVIGAGSTSVDVAPENPNKGFPYFVVRAAGFGGGWAAGNVIRFDTEGCLAPIWMARTVLSGAATVDDDQVVIQFRGDAN